jgi:hypothetical protein
MVVSFDRGGESRSLTCSSLSFSRSLQALFLRGQPVSGKQADAAHFDRDGLDKGKARANELLKNSVW